MEQADDNLIDVQIDGEWHRFPGGTRVIEACRQAGKDVPHYCYHPKLTSPGNCRMCLVEVGMPPRTPPGQDPPKPDKDGHVPIQWNPRPAIACANTIAPNTLAIPNSNPSTRAVRKMASTLMAGPAYRKQAAGPNPAPIR